VLDQYLNVEARSTGDERAWRPWRTVMLLPTTSRLSRSWLAAIVLVGLASATGAKINVVLIPMPRDVLLPALIHGKVDFVMAQVTVRPELQALVDFTTPTRKNVSEVVVTGPGSPAIASVDDLSGKEVFARKHSNFHASLVALNKHLKAKGKTPVIIVEVPGNLEDDDLLEMVNAGLIRTIVVHDYLAEFWKKVFTNLTVHDTVTLRTGGSFAVPIRKGSPLLAAELNAFIAKFGLGTAFGNMMKKRYLESTKFVKSAASEADRKKLLALTELFKKYGNQYQLDYLLMAPRDTRSRSSTTTRTSKTSRWTSSIRSCSPSRPTTRGRGGSPSCGERRKREGSTPMSGSAT
jgi:membrane-bound lytic murein transglycosylase MltF